MKAVIEESNGIVKSVRYVPDDADADKKGQDAQPLDKPPKGNKDAKG